MSQTQSEYISHKKITFQLENQNKLPPVLGSNLYTLCKQYAIVNDNGVQTNSCPVFIMCRNTNTRPNRVLVTSSLFNFPVKFSKFKEGKICFNCCYNSQYNLYTTNNKNTLFSACSNRRLNSLKCNDSLTSGGLCPGLDIE